MRTFVAYIAGVVFAVGLAVGGMTQPEKVVSFLDIFGTWDPSLAFVMGGALLVNLLVYKLLVPRLSSPVVEPKFHIPTRSDIDWQLVTGGAIFGAGWGLGGFCPGPGITAAVTGKIEVLAFVAAMAGGVYLYKAFERFVLQRGGSKDDSSVDGGMAQVDA